MPGGGAELSDDPAADMAYGTLDVVASCWRDPFQVCPWDVLPPTAVPWRDQAGCLNAHIWASCDHEERAEFAGSGLQRRPPLTPLIRCFVFDALRTELH